MTPWQPGAIDNTVGVVSQIGGTRRTAAMVSSSLATVYIQLGEEPGEAVLMLTDLTLQSTMSNIPSYEVEGLKLTINQQGGVKVDPFTVDQ